MRKETVYHTTIESFNDAQAYRRRIEREKHERQLREKLQRRTAKPKPKKSKKKSANHRRTKSNDAGIMPWVVCFLLGCLAVYFIWLV